MEAGCCTSHAGLWQEPAAAWRHVGSATPPASPASASRGLSTYSREATNCTAGSGQSSGTWWRRASARATEAAPPNAVTRRSGGQGREKTSLKPKTHRPHTCALEQVPCSFRGQLSKSVLGSELSADLGDSGSPQL